MSLVFRRCVARQFVKETLAKQHPLYANAVRTIKSKEFLEIPPDTPPPWPYETKRYRWYHSIFNLDKTIWRMNENSKVIVVEGNIGSGKTTLAKELANQLGMKYVAEPNWSDNYWWIHKFDLRDYHNELPMTCQHFEIKEFYHDPFHYNVGAMQVKKYIARWISYLDNLNHLFQTGQGIVFERSVFSDFVFVDAMAKKGYMGQNARKYYYDLKSQSIPECMRPHCIIYLDAPVDVCMERIKKRNIDYEVNSEAMTPEYLQLLEEGYKTNYLPQMEPFCEMLVYDWAKPADAERVVEDLEKINFDKERVYFDPKFRDWRNLYLDSSWDEKRRRLQWVRDDWGQYDTMISDLDPMHGAPELLRPAEDIIVFDRVKEKALAEQREKKRKNAGIMSIFI